MGLAQATDTPRTIGVRIYGEARSGGARRRTAPLPGCRILESMNTGLVQATGTPRPSGARCTLAGSMNVGSVQAAPTPCPSGGEVGWRGGGRRGASVRMGEEDESAAQGAQAHSSLLRERAWSSGAKPAAKAKATGRGPLHLRGPPAGGPFCWPAQGQMITRSFDREARRAYP
jgi:hypothetical protein